jgi:hypothetical protein
VVVEVVDVQHQLMTWELVEGMIVVGEALVAVEVAVAEVVLLLQEQEGMGVMGQVEEVEAVEQLLQDQEEQGG